MAAVEPIDVIRQNLELAKEQLKSVDSDIKKLTGRDPSEDRFLRRNAESNFKRPLVKSSMRAPIVRSSMLDSLNDDRQKVVDDDLQVTLSSSVVPVSETRSRFEALKGLQKSDKDRGRRMLGILQSTLSQFQKESAAATKKPQMEKRRQIDAKVEARERQEKEILRRERAELFRSRREQQIEISILQQKMRMAKEFELWRTETEKMVGFCRTKTKPYIFFRPVAHNSESKRRVDETSKAIHDLIRQRRKRMDLALEESASFRRRNFASLSDQDRLGDLEQHKDKDHLPSLKRNWSPSRNESNVSRSKKARRRSSASESSSDASETFAIEGDGEPVLMEEEQVHVSPASRPVDPSNKSPSKLDTRTVRIQAEEASP